MIGEISEQKYCNLLLLYINIFSRTLEKKLLYIFYVVTSPANSSTWLIVEETTNTSLRSVEESSCHGVIFSICTEQLKETENDETKKLEKDAL